MDSLPLLTLSEVKEHIEMRDNVTKEDARLRMLISAATANIEFATGRQFTEQAFTEHLTTRDNMTTDYRLTASVADVATVDPLRGGLQTKVKPTRYYLKGVNVNQNTLVVHYNPNARDESDYDDGHLLTEADYELDGSVLSILAGTQAAARGLRVQYTAGYAGAPEDEDADPVVNTLSDAIPSDLKMAAILQTMFLRTKTKNDNIGMGTERTAMDKGKVAVSPFLAVTGVTPEALPYLARFKRVRTGRG